MNSIGSIVILFVIFVILFQAMVSGISALEAFKEGAAEGLKTTIQLLPTLIGLITAIHMLRASGFFMILASILQPITDFLHVPTDIVPLMLLRPVSGSGASAYVADLLQQYGPDSIIGCMASVLSASTDTTFYAATVYLGSVGIKKSGWIFPAALLGDLAAAISTIIFVPLLLF